MDIKADLVECTELLNDMLQFLDATTSAQICFKKEINENQHPHCADGSFEEKCDWCLLNEHSSPGIEEEKSPKESAEYMNIVNKIDESRYTLIQKCKTFLRKLEERLWLHKELEEEENSYLEMGGVGHKNDINLTQPTDKIGACENFESDVESNVVVAKERPFNDNNCKNEDELNKEENCYDFTTDRCLYDDCSDMKLNNVASVPVPTEDDNSKCPFSGLPAAHLRIKQSPKFGTLFRQEKRLFFDQSKKFYVGLLDKWLLLYNNCNELKPAQCVQVKDIRLDLNLNDQINEKNQFILVTQDDAKICFLSPSFKELNEWIVAIQQNLPTKTENTPTSSPRKLPLPPTPGYATDELDMAGNRCCDPEDGIYEEPQLLSKRQEDFPDQQHNYDTPKATADICHNLSQHHTKASPTKIINDAPIFPGKANMCEPISHQAVPTVANVCSSTTPVKSWLFNRFNKSPEGHQSNDQKLSRKASKKLSFQQDSGTQQTMPPSHDVAAKPPFTAKITTSSTVPSAANKGSKINMIISQLEANGQLSLLSKSLNDPGKRNTWCLEE